MVLNKKNFFNYLIQYRPILLALILFIFLQSYCLKISDIAQTASKQVVKEKRQWAKQSDAIKDDTDKDLVFFFGASLIAAGVIPDIFDEENGLSTHSYNLGFPGIHTLGTSYFMLKDYLAKNRAPQYIIMEYPGGGGEFSVESFPSYAVQNAGLFEVLQYAYYRGKRDVLYNYLIPSRLRWPEVARYMMGKGISLMPKKIRELHKELYLNRFKGWEVRGHNREYFYESQFVSPEEFTKQRIDTLKGSRGYYYIIEESATGGVVTKKYLSKLGINISDICLDESKRIQDLKQQQKNMILNPDKYFDRFFKLTQKHGIKIVFVPGYGLNKFSGNCDQSKLTTSVTPYSWTLAQRRYGNIYFVEDDPNSIFYDYTYFSDLSHLNPKGAALFSRRLAQSFKQIRDEM